LSQRVKAERFSIQLCGKAVAMEPFMHRQFVIKRENTGFARCMPVAAATAFLFRAYIFETA
jgi:hypothetical protein